MIDVSEYEKLLRNLGEGYFVSDIKFVPDLMSWAKEHDQDLKEPYLPVKVLANPDNTLSIMVQKEVSHYALNSVIRNLGIRWSLRDNVTNIDNKLNSTKKRLVFCFLKERARSMKDVGGDEQIEDQWVIDEMETLGFFKE